MKLGRREVVTGLLASVVAGPSFASTAKVSALPGYWSAEQIASFHRKIAMFEPMTDDLAVPPPFRRAYQRLVGLRYAWLAWPESDAIQRLEAISARWPELKPNVARTIKARLSGKAVDPSLIGIWVEPRKLR